MLNTPTVACYPADYTLYPDGKVPWEEEGRLTAATKATSLAHVSSPFSDVSSSISVHYGAAGPSPPLPAAEPSLPATSPVFVRLKHPTPQLMAKTLKNNAVSLPPLRLRNRTSLKKTTQKLFVEIQNHKRSQSVPQNILIDANLATEQKLPLLERRRKLQIKDTMAKFDPSNDKLPLNRCILQNSLPRTRSLTVTTSDLPSIASPSISSLLVSGHVRPLVTQIKHILAAEEAYLKRLELLRDSYWKPLCLRYPMQSNTNGATTSAVCSVAWSSTSDEDGEDDDDDDASSDFNADDDKSTELSSAAIIAKNTALLKLESALPSIDTFTDIQIDDTPSIEINIQSTGMANTTSTANAQSSPMAFNSSFTKPRTSSLASTGDSSCISSFATSTDNNKPSEKPVRGHGRRESVWMRIARLPSWNRRDSEPMPAIPLTTEPAEITSTPSNTSSLLSTLSTALSSRSTRSKSSIRSSVSSFMSIASTTSSRAPSIASIHLQPALPQATAGRHSRRTPRAPVRLCDAIRPYTSIAQLLDVLFGQLTAFIKLQTALVEALHQLDLETVTHQDVASLFLEHGEEFEVYADYAANHAVALAALENLRLTNPRFRRHLRHLRPDPLDDGYDVDKATMASERQKVDFCSDEQAKESMELTNMLGLPLKRIWHYVSTFESLKRHAIQAVPLGDRQPALIAIQEFLDTLDSLDLRMNTYKRQIERVCQIAQLQRKIRHLPTLLLTNKQFILHEGSITWAKTCTNKDSSDQQSNDTENDTAPVYCWLLRDRILIGHQRASGAYTHKMTIRLSECTVYAPPINSKWQDGGGSAAKGGSLYVSTADESIRLYFEERRMFERWCGQIRLALTTLPRDAQTATEVGRIINANTTERWNPSHAGCYVHVDVFPAF
ncbi:hypothetical protein BDF19DRAFT_466608 [Syncephalis fuscata]|nr:hypothetical protein BDF19DRAFT_466608 [Syncephalis fuscata]